MDRQQKSIVENYSKKRDIHNIIFKENSLINEFKHIDVKEKNTIKIKIERNSEVNIFLSLSKKEYEENFLFLDIEVFENSKLNYIFLVNENAANQNTHHQFSLHKNAKLNMINGFFSKELKSIVSVDLNGEGSEVLLNSVVISSDKSNQSVDSKITHYAPNSYGDMYNIAIAKDQGKVILNGIEKIKKGNFQANSFQTLKGIILSDEATVEVNPILLIDEYDVKAGHGATIGKIEEEQMYYLQSRGLTKLEAEKMIINSYINPIVDKINDEDIHKDFERAINKKI
jgi:Fe-S cluster assembly protein SufD